MTLEQGGTMQFSEGLPYFPDYKGEPMIASPELESLYRQAASATDGIIIDTLIDPTDDMVNVEDASDPDNVRHGVEYITHYVRVSSWQNERRTQVVWQGTKLIGVRHKTNGSLIPFYNNFAKLKEKRR